MKKDLLEECLDSEFLKKSGFGQDITPDSFAQIFCKNCKNSGCFRAGHGLPLWEGRMMNQEDRLYYPQYTADGDPRYLAIHQMEFEDMAHKDRAVVVEDWSAPTQPALPASSLPPPISSSDSVGEDPLEFVPGLDAPPSQPPPLSPAQTAKEVLRLPTFNSPRQMNVVVGGGEVEPAQTDPWAVKGAPKASTGLVRKGKAYRFGGDRE